jgi:hypothetical protein
MRRLFADRLVLATGVVVILMNATADEQFVRERATNADNFDPAELPHGHRSEQLPPFTLAVVPILIVLAVNLLMSLLVLPRMYTGFLAEPRFGETRK